MQEKTITSFDGTKIFYKIQRQNGPFLFLLHGGSGSSNSWCFQIPRLISQGFSLVVVDQRGHGLSGRGSRFEFFSADNYSKDLNEIFAQEGIGEAILVGHSYGGQIVQRFYQLFPDKVRALVLISTKFDYSAGVVGWATNLIMRLVFLFGSQGVPNNNYTNYEKFTNSADLNLFRILRDIKCCSFKTYAATIIQGNNFKNENFKDIKVPSLLIHGKKDMIMPHKQAEKVGTQMPNFEMVTLPTNHITLLNQPQEISDFIVKFASNI